MFFIIGTSPSGFLINFLGEHYFDYGCQ
jgi:hypothetical protein